MKPGTEVGLGSGHIVLDGDLVPPKGAQPPIFGTCLSWTNNWMDEDATWCGGKPRPRPHCVRIQLPLKRGHTTPHFSAHVFCGQAVAHLSYCWAFVIFAGWAWKWLFVHPKWAFWGLWSLKWGAASTRLQKGTHPCIIPRRLSHQMRKFVDGSDVYREFLKKGV